MVRTIVYKFPCYMSRYSHLKVDLDANGTTTYMFDADGNQQIVEEPNGDLTTYSWDYENKNTLIQLPTLSRETMSFNPDGIRVEKQS
ncbi:MAG: hypothetical protein HUJ26_20075 [Planctomycetaceae bacterium]|nr:hypothetical protein [Planctomycetaceae bacterium]